MATTTTINSNNHHQQQQQQVPVPREAIHASPSVISSSNYNQGEAAECSRSLLRPSPSPSPASSSSSTPNTHLPPTTIYASLSDINCSSNAKTYLYGKGNGNEADLKDCANAIQHVQQYTTPADGPATNRGWGIPKGLGLRGGGENSLNTGTSGWGTPPAAGGAGWGGAAPGPAQGQWGGNRPPGPGPPANPNANVPGAEFNNQNKPGGAPPASGNSNNGAAAPAPANGAGAAAAPTTPTTGAGAVAGGNTSWAQAAGKGLPQGGPSPPQNSTTKQIEQLNSMREALFAQDGWGGQHVNQDTSWDTPGSPEPANAKGEAGAASNTMWKQNVNNGTDLWEANLRNGGQPPAQPQNKTPWGHTPTTNIGGTWGEEDEASDGCNVWTGAPGAPGAPGGQGPWPGGPGGPWPEKKPEWGGAGNGGGAAAVGGGQWGDPRAAAPPMDPNNLPLNDMNMMRMRGDAGVMRGDPRGVSGRLNNTDQMWAAHQPPPTPKLPTLPPGSNQWSGGLPKEMGGMVNAQGKPSGWEEPSPPAQRRNIPNYDDGTSLWGQQQQTRLPQPAPGVAGNKSHWDKLGGNNMGRGNMPCPTGMPGARMPTAAPIKPDGVPGWNQPRHGAWDAHDGGGGWGEENKLSSAWPGDSPLTPPSWSAKGGGKPAGWGEDVSDGVPWPPHPSMQRPNMPNLTKISSEIIYGSKQFRTLCDMGYKKEDVESALRNSNMSMAEAMDQLSNYGRREEHGFDQSLLRGSGFNPVQTLNFGGAPGNGGNNPSMSLNKMIGQTQVGGGGGGGQARPSAAQPSAQQLKMLIQQIQMAVQTGYLNHQILNQPLAPPTLMLVNQLLQQIKNLQALHQKQSMISMSGQIKNNGPLLAQLQLQIAKAKQNIQNFQNQITGHQTTYMKQQQQQQQQQQQPDPTSELFKNSFPDSLTPLSNFQDLTMSDKSSMSSFQTQSQSRLNQWKLPLIDKDSEGTDFSRAPGSAKGHSANLNEAWSTGNDGGWPGSAGTDLSEKESQWSTSQQNNSMADFIPEFEPGKPWKGTQMKTVEEDPSMTPGSVARSPLSMATIKDSDILSDSNKASPGPPGSVSGQDNSVLTSLGLSSSPWTTLNSGTSSVYTSPLSKLTSSKSWGESVPGTGADLWLNPKTTRGPPPGLGNKLGQTQPNWTGGGSRSSWGSSSSSSSWGSPWLILRNLTPQIDGSTLKTLCMQHGPLQNFHLHLNVGTALAKYCSREEASKAQQALNNCVLGNTTIFAESPAESDVVSILNQMGHSNSQNTQQPANWNIRTSQTQPNPSKSNDTWATSAGSLPGYGGSGNLWQSSTSSNSLWNNEGDAHRTTPSSFLPPDLLNGETM